VVVDVETAGFNSHTDALLEVAMVTLKIDRAGYLRIDQRMSANIQPFKNAHISEEALKFTGIDPFDPNRNALSEYDALSPMLSNICEQIKQQQCTRAILVGHNAHFDQNFIKAAIQRSGLKKDPFHLFSHLDTASLAALTLGETVLAKACQRAKLSFDNKQAHSAVYDADKTAELFCYMVNRWYDLGGWPL
jgi:ribonuclease T